MLLDIRSYTLLFIVKSGAVMTTGRACDFYREEKTRLAPLYEVHRRNGAETLGIGSDKQVGMLLTAAISDASHFGIRDLDADQNSFRRLS